ncbi:uncharacterized protein LOC116660598 [Camelus ferus]|uniref:Uncharacterized protein LOC116660598 n=1 Tax=Camelus ferus TaxID=419612 RepID=A0A8B8S955_CAMFR|nr:uncharacterized protein LOC116660598 [Camelus ferus]
MEAPPHPLDPLAQEDRDGSGKDSSDEGLGMDFLGLRKVFLHKEEERGVLGQRARTASFQGSAPVRVGVGVRTQPPTAPLPRLGSPTWETLLPAPSPIFSSAGLQLPRANHLSHAAGLSSSLGCQEALPLLHVLWLGIPDKHKRCWTDFKRREDSQKSTILSRTAAVFELPIRSGRNTPHPHLKPPLPPPQPPAPPSSPTLGAVVGHGGMLAGWWLVGGGVVEETRKQTTVARG